ncbi:hypothetical protein CXQ85_004104 [Candidozyma haemuli]|uniref:Inactive metallocarboxypeptidase ECM14 n=1 Tax=Candidozyma haemuli TaxID=45357 RepID=A0A2V1B0F7_9ASCO|nr:hypothetical protein CXQ85_004104 [[Candida] haemuloni]PVH23810.1 hypothetical protein CXQ85_004104 [[Candida] haemuloni]
MKLGILFAAVVAASQIRLMPHASEKQHYKSVPQAEHPIDLNQYENDFVVRMPYTNESLKYLKNQKLKIWSSNGAKQTLDVQLNSAQLAQLGTAFDISKAEVIIPDLAQAVYESYPDKTENVFAEEVDFKTTSEVFFKDYRSLEDIHQWLHLLEETYPDLIKMETIGHTYEGRPFRVVHLSVKDRDVDHEQKKTVVITGGVHAREWISVSTVLYSVYAMLRHWEENPHDSKTLAQLDFLFIPVLNPDGYVYSWETDRLWRKNRQPVEGGDEGSCRGVDIDHSFDYHWTPSSESVCSEDYAGKIPFEAYEARVWDEYLNKTNEAHHIHGYIDLHSYDQEILYPYVYSCEHQPRDEENLIELAYGISKSIRWTSGKYYAVSPACLDRDSDLLPELGSGTALDYMYHHRAFWAYQLKLRDSGSHGFLLPKRYIEPVGEEVSAGLKYFCKFILTSGEA